MQRSNPKDTKDSRRDIREWRCDCGRLLFKGALLVGLLEVKCSRCKRMVYLQQFESYTAERQSFMITAGIEGTIFTASEGVKSPLGYDPTEIVGTNLIDYINPNLHEAASFWIESIHGKGEGDIPYTSLIAPLITKDKSEKIFSLLVRPTHLSGKDIFLVVAEAGLDSAEIHDRKVISKLARKGRSKREGWDFIIDKEGLIGEVSGMSKAGYLEEDILGKSLLDLVQSDTMELIARLKGDESFVLDLDLRTKSSGTKKYKVCFMPDFIAEPRGSAFVVSFRSQEAQQSPSTSQTSAA